MSTPTPSLNDLRAAAVAAEQPAAQPAPAQQPVPTPPPAPQVTEIDGIKYGKNAEGKYFAELPTGARYLGDSEQQVAINIAKGKVEADRTIQTLRQPPPPPQPLIPQEPAEVIAARNYLLDELAKGVGLPDGNALRQRLDTIGQTVDMNATDQVAAGFYNLCPEFPTSEQNIETLTAIASANGFPETPQGLRAAHLIAVSEGKYTPLTADQIREQQMRALGLTQAQISPPTPAPMLPGTSAQSASPSFNPYDRKVPLDQVRAWALGEQK